MMSADPAPHLSPTTTIALPWKAPSFAVVKGIIHATGAKPKMKLKSLMLSSNAAEPDIVIRPIPGALAMAVLPSPKLSNGRLTPSHTWPAIAAPYSQAWPL
jgi:hypothetical protein